MLRLIVAAALGLYLGSVALVFLSTYNAQKDLVDKLEIPVSRSFIGRYAVAFAWRGPFFLYRETYRSVGLSLMEMVGLLEMRPGMTTSDDADAPPVPDEIAQLMMRMGHAETSGHVS